MQDAVPAKEGGMLAVLGSNIKTNRRDNKKK